MRGRGADAAGFSLVEIVIAMLILGFIAIALLPPLAQGIGLASKQALTATATRQLNALIEEGREAHTCATLTALAPATFIDGKISVEDAGFVCVPGTVNKIELTARDSSGDILGVATARVLVDS